jgi:hypothetical protein
VPELGTLGSVRGALSNERPYRDLRNVIAKYLFEKSRRFAEIQPNFGHGDHSRLSCGATSGSQWLHEIKLEVEGPDGGGIRREEPGAFGPSQWLPRPYLGRPAPAVWTVPLFA